MRRWVRVVSYVAGGVVLLLLVACRAAVVAGPPVVPADRRRHRRARARRPTVDGAARRPRHPADLRRHRRRPVPRAGLRAGAGPVLRDGLPPAHHRRPALRAVRRARRSRPTSSSARWAGAGSPSRSCRCSARRRSATSRPTPTASTPTSTRPHARRRSSLEYTVLGARRPRLQARAVDAGRLAGLAQGDGVGPARQHGRRARARPRRRPTSAPAQIAELYPPYPYDRHPPIVDQGAVVDGVFEQDATARRHPQAVRAPALPAAERDAAAPAATRPLAHACPTLLGAAATASARTPGWSPASTPRPASRSSPTTRTSASSMPGIWYQMGLHCTHGRRDCPFDVAGFTFSGLPGRRDRPQRRDRLGVHQPRPRRHRPLPRAGRRQDRTCYDGRRRPLRMRDEVIKVARRRRAVPVHGARRPGTARCSPTSSTELSTRRARTRRPATDAPARGNGYAVALAWTALHARHHRRRDLRARPGHRLGRVPGRRRGLRGARAEPGLRRPRRPHRLPGARAGSRSASPATTATARRRAGCRPTTGPAATSRSTRCRACSTPPTASSSTANQAVTGPDYPYYLGDSWDYGYRSQRIRDLLSARPRLSVADMAADPARHPQRRSRRRWCRTCSTIVMPLGVPTPAASGCCSGWDFHAGPPTRRPRRTSTRSGATCSS